MKHVHSFVADIMNGAAIALLFMALLAGLSQNAMADYCCCCCQVTTCDKTENTTCAACTVNFNSGQCLNPQKYAGGKCDTTKPGVCGATTPVCVNCVCTDPAGPQVPCACY